MSLIASILGAKKGPLIGGIQVDVAISETHRRRWDVTREPIETGSQISDNRVKLPEELEMEGVVSDRPTNLFDLITQPLSAQDRYLALLDLANENEVFDVVTGLQVYENMTFTAFEVQRNETTGEIVRFRASLQEIRFADAQVTKVVVNIPDAPKAKPTGDLGPKALKQAKPEVKGPTNDILIDTGIGTADAAKNAIGWINRVVPRP